ncbi:MULTISPECIES: ABC transporter ATP-binding protein [unclassified Pseudomonas]|uniref:ABC transporter ATP-binding protein n=1 Tax=unclassified Pseudomonas TaxID=196821 RepID=UPI00244C95AE|nr:MULTISPECIES: ABC transporter ATP-binding protein [unclassified Pseudomonas]MDG9930943.1 ABC transporter ATP-binding protein/permease [Pseudomonas sp. GD04042]MDH0485366.1 ABC transporter ATP-binding protein/permease [Pseudomonas sp. GD04015]MDH0606080.1 ABC transporter ATP-binding protein/permease [Pseudomonas sp. GD03869]
MKASDSLRAFRQLLQAAPRAWVLGLVMLLTLSGLTEGIGILLLVPLLEMLQDAGTTMLKPVEQAFRVLGVTPSAAALLALFTLLVGLRCAIQYGREQLALHLQHRVVDDLRLDCFRALLGTEWRWLAERRQSDHTSLLLNDINRIGQGVGFGLGLLSSMATMLVYLATAFLLSWQMAGLALASGLLVWALLRGHRRRALGLGQGLLVANRDLQGNMQDSLATIKLAKILGSEARHFDELRQTTDRLRTQQLRFAANSSLSKALFQTLGAALLAIYLFVGLSLWRTPLAEMVVLVLIFARLIPMFVGAQQQLHHWLHSMPALLEVDRLLGECRASAEPVDGLEAIEPLALEREIRLHGVSLHYSDRSASALDGLSLCFPALGSTAIIGASGSGKSSLADLLAGLLTPDQGSIEVDGVPLLGEARMRWRRSVAYVPQEVFLFHDSIRGNLLRGDPQATEADLRHVLQRAAADFVFRLPQGLDTMVGDAGVRLSGGERQRLALARALLRKPALLILDEATSALDPNNERRIQDAIDNLQGEITLVIIGHRQAALEHVEHVIVLDKGRLLTEGDWTRIRATLKTGA